MSDRYSITVEEALFVIDTLLDAIEDHRVAIDIGAPREDADADLYDTAQECEEELEG